VLGGTVRESQVADLERNGRFLGFVTDLQKDFSGEAMERLWSLRKRILGNFKSKR
jgi:hypothetical protein